MYKKLFATLLAFMFIVLNSICLVSFSHAMADSGHVDHEHVAEVTCTHCNEQSNSSTMTCCIDASEKQVNLTVYNRSLSVTNHLVLFPHISASDLATITTKERRYLAYHPPLIRVGIVVKKE